jgi:hypothetical protein
MKAGQGFWGIIARICILTLIASALQLNGATLKWAPNPASENVAFYTVYIDSPLGTITREIGGEPSFSLDELLPTIVYTLSVSATSMEGIESERSAGVPYILGFPLPAITSHPADMTLPSGTPLVLTVAATGPTGLKFEWYKDNRPIPEQFLPVLSIVSPTPADSGTYTAVVSTPGGHVESHPAVIIVQDPPRIITQPTSISLGVDTPFQLSIDASGTDLRYQWFKNGQPIASATNSILSFPKLTLADKGSYRVDVWNLVDRIASEAAILDVFYLPVTFAGGPYATNLVEGGTIRLSVDVTGSAPFTFLWLKNGIPISWATNASLVISSANTNDSGSYRVNVANPISYVTSSAAMVTVSPPPPFSDCTLTMSTTANGFVRISAVASPNTTYELQRTDSLKNPNWVRMQDAVADASGRFVISVSAASQTGFIRTVRK